jgi:hypothetical protein
VGSLGNGRMGGSRGTESGDCKSVSGGWGLGDRCLVLDFQSF